MQNKFILFAVLAALSGTATAGPTLADLADADAQLKMAELQTKLNEAKAKAEQAAHPASAQSASAFAPSNGASPQQMQAPVPVASVIAAAADDTEEVHLEAIYGVGGVLKADVSYNGSSTTLSLSPEGVRKVGPWTLREISPYRVVLMRAARKKGDKQAEKEMFVSSSSEKSDKAEKLNLNASPTTVPGGMPTMMPTMPSPMVSSGTPSLPPIPVATTPRSNAPGVAPTGRQ